MNWFYFQWWIPFRVRIDPLHLCAMDLQSVVDYDSPQRSLRNVCSFEKASPSLIPLLLCSGYFYDSSKNMLSVDNNYLTFFVKSRSISYFSCKASAVIIAVTSVLLLFLRICIFSLSRDLYVYSSGNYVFLLHGFNLILLLKFYW